MNASTEIDALLRLHNAKDLLRFITCGNVDDGKSTLIGRLLLEAGAIYDDQVEALKQESSKYGTVGERIDTALLLDGLEDERQQGITIDVAYRYFSTPTRKFIIADTPGHEQFTRNMATGASTADLAIILVDASKGVSTQTRRHAFIVSLLGIQQVVLAVNKMDLVSYAEDIFAGIVEEFQRFTSQLSFSDICCIPLSALEGDNVVQASQNMAWYQGLSLLDHLNSVQFATDASAMPLRLPIQWVNRPNARFRGFSGSIASGVLKTGDEILVLPSRKSARVISIVTMDGELNQAMAGDAVTVTLSSEIDVTRGDMLVRADSQPSVVSQAEATLVWMSSHPLVSGKQYWLKHTTRRTTCEIEAIRFRTDVNTLERLPSQTLALNEIGRCRVKMHDVVMCDPYTRNRETGGFIIVDRITHETVAAGMFLESASSPETSGHWEQDSSLSAPQAARSLVSQQDRLNRFGPAKTILITGLSCSGKTSVALELEKRLFDAGRACIVLDGQNLRLGISRDLGFSAEERSENLRRAAEIAKIINDSGQICIAAFVAPSAWVRHKVRDLIGSDSFFHVHLSTSLEVCRSRDRTGQYRAADRGVISSFPGVSFEYEMPDDAHLFFDTDVQSIDEIATAILQAISD